MTGMEAFKRALRLLNYTDTDGETDAAGSSELYKRALAITDQICGDLGQCESGEMPPSLTSLYTALPISAFAARQVLPYGIAMMLAAGRGDGDNQALFSALYTQKRENLFPKEEPEPEEPEPEPPTYAVVDQRVDVLPRGCVE